MPSFVLIHPTVWPQYTNVTDKTDNGRTDSIGRTVLQTIAQKSAIQLLWRATVWPQKTWAKNGEGCCAFLGQLGPHLTCSRLGRGRPPYQVASWCIRPFGNNRHGPKIGGCYALFFGGAGSASNTM